MHSLVILVLCARSTQCRHRIAKLFVFLYFLVSFRAFSLFKLVCCFWTGTLVRRNFSAVTANSDQLSYLNSWRWTTSPPHYFLISALSNYRFGHLRLNNHVNNSDEDWRAAWKKTYSSGRDLNPNQNSRGLRSCALIYWAIKAAIAKLWLFSQLTCRSSEHFLRGHQRPNRNTRICSTARADFQTSPAGKDFVGEEIAAFRILQSAWFPCSSELGCAGSRRQVPPRTCGNIRNVSFVTI